MFAGATREVVFANPAVVRLVKSQFIPVALKAGLVNNPPRGVEGDLYAEIARSRPAPQGICVANSSGKALAWALSFDDDESIVKFLDYAAGRYKQFPDDNRPVVAERYMSFPGRQLTDVEDSGNAVTIPDGHAQGDHCPAKPALRPGTLVGRVIGRALDEQGRPLADTVRQENYLESRFEIPLATQTLLSRAAVLANGKPFHLPDEFTRTLVGQAFLGQLDVNPLGSVPGSQNDSRQWEFRARLVPPDEAGTVRLRIEGTSRVAGSQRVADRRRSDGRIWEHAVTLTWQGYADLRADRVTQLVMLAEGDERLRWGNARLRLTTEPDSAHLMAGHPIDFEGSVRYGLLAEPYSPESNEPGAADSRR